jgi:hypothetical protein
MAVLTRGCIITSNTCKYVFNVNVKYITIYFVKNFSIQWPRYFGTTRVTAISR